MAQLCAHSSARGLAATVTPFCGIAEEGYQGVGLDEYMKMVMAGLAGSSGHMVGAAVSALARLLFEFGGKVGVTQVAFTGAPRLTLARRSAASRWGAAAS